MLKKNEIKNVSLEEEAVDVFSKHKNRRYLLI